MSVQDRAKLDKHAKPRGQEKRSNTRLLGMMYDPIPEFSTLSGQLIDACDRVRCSPQEYLDGLGFIMGEIEIALQAAKESFPDTHKPATPEVNGRTW